MVSVPLPEWLQFYNRWSIAVHFALGLLGVSAVRDYDAVAESHIRELKAEAARQDIITIRKAAADDNPVLLLAAKLRGWLDGLSGARKLLRDKLEFSAGDVKPDRPGALYLPSGADESFPESDLIGVSGKCWRQ